MTTTKPLSSSKDNLLGICHALGEDFGFNPLWLRLALGAAFVVQPAGVVIGYLALGLVVLVSRLAFPDRRATSVVLAGRHAADTSAVVANEPEEQMLANAA